MRTSWASGRYISGRVALATFSCGVSATTPTMVTHVPAGPSRPVAIRRPIGSSSPNTWRASVALTSATAGAVRASRASKPRPRSSGTPSAACHAGETSRQQVSRLALGATSRPSTRSPALVRRPVSGSACPTAAAVTPGRARRRSSTLAAKPRSATLSWLRARGKSRRAVRRRCASKPSGARCRRSSVPSSRPAAFTSTTASGHLGDDDQRRARGARRGRPWACGRSRAGPRARRRAPRRARGRGSRARRTRASRATESASTLPDRRSPSSGGRLAGQSAVISGRLAQASASPARQPRAAISSASVTSWRARRPRPAPSAARTASSWPRPAVRASSRFATLAQATSSTQRGGAQQQRERGTRAAAQRLEQRLDARAAGRRSRRGTLERAPPRRGPSRPGRP